MKTRDAPIPMIQAPSLPGPHEGYMPGFGNDFETEALPDALPQGMNGPQNSNYGRYGEQMSGTSFSKPGPERTKYDHIRPLIKGFAPGGMNPRTMLPHGPDHSAFKGADGTPGKK